MPVLSNMDYQSSEAKKGSIKLSRGGVLNSILDYVGNTPLVRLNKIPIEEGVECEILAKCEFLNPGGSIKDRIGKNMVESAEKEGKLIPGISHLVEPTSGNTGIGIALAAAVKGYKATMTMPKKMSNEKINVLKALGADVIRTPTEAAFDSPESHIEVARKMEREDEDVVILDQYNNPQNPLAHYNGTAEELLEQTEDKKIDVCVIAAGTGGTITGIAKKLKEQIPGVEIVGVDPVGSILAQPEELNDKNRLKPYKVEGIGYDFIPSVMDRSLVDYWVKTEDKEAFYMARRLIASEGMLVGGSSGSALCGAIKALKDLGYAQDSSKRVVVIFADGIRNYMTKFLSDEWLEQNNFSN
eukprot:maker-scaffold_84-snap-gene-0.52-mRNA-1 protein AED:0.07 eAED:0.07 QI:227/1/1/1/0.75/0.6/5/409/355